MAGGINFCETDAQDLEIISSIGHKISYLINDDVGFSRASLVFAYTTAPGHTQDDLEHTFLSGWCRKAWFGR
jgi:hypothetical protein